MRGVFPLVYDGRVARPSALTPERRERIESALEDGIPIAIVAQNPRQEPRGRLPGSSLRRADDRRDERLLRGGETFVQRGSRRSVLSGRFVDERERIPTTRGTRDTSRR